MNASVSLHELKEEFQTLSNWIDQRPLISQSQWNTLRDRYKYAITQAERCWSYCQGSSEITTLYRLLREATGFLFEARTQRWITGLQSNPRFSQFVAQQCEGLDQVLSAFGNILNTYFEPTTTIMQEAKAQDSRDLKSFIRAVDQASPAPSELARAFHEGNLGHLDKVTRQVLDDNARLLSSESDLAPKDVNQAQEIAKMIMNVTGDRLAPDLLLSERFVGSVDHYRSTTKYDLYLSKFVTGETVLIKALRKNMNKVDIVTQIEMFQRRAKVWHGLRSEYTLPFYGTGKWETNGQIQLFSVAPFLKNGDAVAYYEGHDVSILQSLQLALDVARALQYLHTRNPPTIHFGVRTDNVLIGKNGRAVLAGFGLIEEAEYHHTAAQTGLGSEHYRFLAPELLGHSCTRKASADVWSWGMTALELVSQKKPFYKVNDFTAAQLISQGSIPERVDYPGTGSIADADGFWRLLKKCWSQDERARPQMDDVVSEMARIFRSNQDQFTRVVSLGDPTSRDSEPHDGRPSRPVAEGRKPGQK